jgi:NADH dehydrogenase
MSMNQGLPRVVILGGGFGGLYAAKVLGRRSGVHVTLIDRCNHHLFQPLLYEVAMAALSPADIAAPIRRVLARNRNTSVIMGEAVAIDTKARRVQLADAEIGYDWLIVATGATHSYLGHDEWERFAPGLKSIDDALEIRRRFLLAFEAAEREGHQGARRAKLSFVVVGGGATGVETAGTMTELARRGIPRDFRLIDTKTARVILVEALDRLLPAFPRDLSERARRDLEHMGVEVRLNSRVTHIDAHGVRIGDERIDAENVVWAAGVRASSIGATLGVPLDHSGRVIVGPDLTIPGQNTVFVIGDLASARDARGTHVPGIAPAAMQMGRYAARIICSEVRTRTTPGQRQPFHYVDKGMLATIGRARAVGVIFGMKVRGLIAWLLWAGVHVIYLIGFRNRLIVMLQWAWAYLIFHRGARLITGAPKMELRAPRTDEP